LFNLLRKKISVGAIKNSVSIPKKKYRSIVISPFVKIEIILDKRTTVQIIDKKSRKKSF
tara:strand:+ start:501 stop:677 length:177 start_codon:yes stop_codon:yes gene_type:complete